MKRQQILYIVFILLIWSCVTTPHLHKPKTLQIRPICEHTASLCAMVFHTNGYEVRIQGGPSLTNFNEQHCQAQAKINGEWVWLRLKGGVVVTTTQDKFKAVETIALPEFINKYVLTRNKKPKPASIFN